MTTPTPAPAPMTATPDRQVGRIEDCTKENLIAMVQRAGQRASEREDQIAALEVELAAARKTENVEVNAAIDRILAACYDPQDVSQMPDGD